MIKLNRKGFTLVELLAVIVILALLMVVATRTIGTSLTNSKNKAMQTEINKIVSKTYEEANTVYFSKGFGSFAKDDFSYATGGTGNYTNNTIIGEDGDYKYTVTLKEDVRASGNVILVDDICINDGKNGYKSKAGYSIVNGNTVKFDENAVYTANVTCSVSGS